MEFPITIFMIPVVAVVVVFVAGLYLACKPYMDEQERTHPQPIRRRVPHPRIAKSHRR